MRLPYVLLLIIVWATLRFSGIDCSAGSVFGTALFPLSLIALVVEFYRSGDIGLGSFRRDLAFALVEVVVASVALTTLVTRGDFVGIADLLVVGATLCDAWIGPVNSFRTALRNVSGTVQVHQP